MKTIPGIDQKLQTKLKFEARYKDRQTDKKDIQTEKKMTDLQNKQYTLDHLICGHKLSVISMLEKGRYLMSH